MVPRETHILFSIISCENYKSMKQDLTLSKNLAPETYNTQQDVRSVSQRTCNGTIYVSLQVAQSHQQGTDTFH